MIQKPTRRLTNVLTLAQPIPYLLAILIVFVFCAPSTAQIADLPPQRKSIDSEFAEALETLAKQCDQLNLVEAATITRQWFVKRQPDKLYCFVPPEKDLLAPNESAEKNVQFWYKHFRNARAVHAEKLFALAGELAEKESNAQAFQLLHEILHEDPDHANARAALGYEKTKEGVWLQGRAQIRSSKANRDQSIVGWKRRTYWQVISPHFRIDCGTDKETGEKLARDAERWYSVWRQLYFDYWYRGQSVKNWIKGTSSDTGSKHLFEVILFKNRDQYLNDLSNVNGIENSTGYYNDQQQRSFFYVDQEATDTWRHELTHQWFQETIPTRNKPSEESGACTLEGIAMFMESMQEFETVITLGGFDANRLQFARMRFHRDEFFVPNETSMAMGREALQQHADIQQIYSQSAGVCHYLMLSDKRDAFIQFLKSFYEKSGGKRSLVEFVGEMQELDRAYQSWLFPVDKSFVQELFPTGQTAMSIPKSGMTDDLLVPVSRCTSLVWLELSNNPIGDKGVAYLKTLARLRQLFVDSTRVSNEGAREICSIKTLEQLDLSATAITDEAINEIATLGELQVLWLAKTKVSDACLKKIAEMKSLQVLDIRATEITQAGVDQLKEMKPELRVFY